MAEVQRLSLSTLPQAIIEIILCLLPTEEAARTSILSREWRYKWTTIPKLEFDGSYVVKRSAKEIPLYLGWRQMYDLERARCKEIRCEYLNAIHQVLLLRQGPIHEFTLVIDAHDTSFEVDQIILNLSRNHIIKKLNLTFCGSQSCDLPTSVFSLPHLTDLYLVNCVINHTPIFNGFGSLITSLSIRWISGSTECVLHLLSNCPSLKSLYLPRIAKIFGDESPDIVDLFKCLPMIEHLTISGCFVKKLVQVSVSEELPTSLVHLKYCTIEDCFFYSCLLSFLCVLIKCSPNLEKIKLELIRYVEYEEAESNSDILKEYSDVRLEHLNELEIEGFRNYKIEMDFVRFILARSPNLKKVILQLDMHNKYAELEMTKVLLRAPRASPVEIIVNNRV